MSENETNDVPSDLDAILQRIAPERHADFLRSRLRLKQFHENDELLALANYLDTIAVLVDGLTKNLVPAPETDLRKSEAHLNRLTGVAQRLDTCFGDMQKKLAVVNDTMARLESVTCAQRRTAIKLKWTFAAIITTLILLTPLLTYQYGRIVGERQVIVHSAQTFYSSAELAPWLSAHQGVLIFRPARDAEGHLFHSIIVLHPTIQSSDVGLSNAGEAFINLRD